MPLNSGGGGGGSSGGVRAGAAFIELYARDNALRRGLAVAEARVKAFGRLGQDVGASLFSFAGRAASSGMNKLLGGIRSSAVLGLLGGGAIAGGLGKFAKDWLDWAGDIQDAADRLGTTTEEVSALAFAAEQSGASLEDVEAGVKNLFKSVRSNEGAEAFAAIGIDPNALGGKPLLDQISMIAEGLSNIREGGDRGALALKVFGKSGLQLLPLMKDGAAGIRALVDGAGRVGAVITGEQAAAAERIGDLISRAWTSAKHAIMSVGAALIPHEATLSRISDAIVDGSAALKEWIENNRGLALAIGAGAIAVAGLSAAVIAFGPTLSAFATGIAIPAQLAIAGLAAGAGILATTLGLAGSAVAGALGMIGTVLSGLVSAAGFLFSPGGLLVVGAAAATGTLGNLFDVIGSIGSALRGLFPAIRGTVGALADFGRDALAALGAAFDGIGERFQRAMASVAEVAEKTWGGIVSAIGRGDLAAAGDIALSGLKLAWLKVKPELEAVWLSLQDGLGKAWDSLIAKLKDAWSGVRSAIEQTVARVEEIIAKLMPLIEFVGKFGGKPEEAAADVADELTSGLVGKIGGAIADQVEADNPAMIGGQVGPPQLDDDLQARSRRAAELQREALDLGLPQAIADMISRGVMQGFGEGTDAAVAMRELERRRELAGADRAKGEADAGAADALGRISGEIQAGLDDALRAWGDVGGKVGDVLGRSFRNAVDITNAERDLRAKLDAEKAKQDAENAKREAEQKANPGGANPQAARPNLDALAKTLPIAVKGLFDSPNFAQALGYGDQSNIKALKAAEGTEANTARIAKGVDKLAARLAFQ